MSCVEGHRYGVFSMPLGPRKAVERSDTATDAAKELRQYARRHRREGETEGASLVRACAERPDLYAAAEGVAVEREPEAAGLAAEIEDGEYELRHAAEAKGLTVADYCATDTEGRRAYLVIDAMISRKMNRSAAEQHAGRS